MKFSKFLQFILLFIVFWNSLNSQGQISPKALNPPANLVIEHELTDPNISLSWWVPGTPFWLHYDSGEYASNIGLNAPGEFDVLVAYEPDQLKPYVGMGITQFAFTPSEAAAVYILKIWTGNSADSVIYEDTLSGLTINAWNSIELDSAVIIEPDRLYFFGYHVNAQGGYPAGCDAGPTVSPGKSDLLRLSDGIFYSLNYSGIDVNWNVQVFLEPQSDKIATKALQSQDITFPFQKTDKLSLNLLNQIKTFTFTNKVLSPSSFNVYRNNKKIGSTLEPNYHDILVEGGIFTYAVSAVYSEGESELSDSVSIIYDVNRFQVNKVIAEAFIHSDASQSPNSYGVYKGIFELAFEKDNLAPIIYHSGSSVFGDDPFSTPDGEERWMEYFFLYSGFPMAVFNGGFAFPGGSTSESLVYEYMDLYDQAYNQLTPISFNCSIEKISSTKYKLNANAQMVGYYLNDHFKLHLVLTRDSIAYNWYNGKFEEVSFVATGMFPDYNGTLVSFGGNNTLNQSVNFEIDPFENIDNYSVVAFIQDTLTHQILNGDVIKLPKKKSVSFSVFDKGKPLENAAISVNGTTLLTDITGQAAINLFDNLGEVSYTITCDNYEAYSGVFNMDTASHITVNLVYNHVSDQEGLSIRVFPNPAYNYLYIQSSQSVTVDLYTISGVLVMESRFSDEHHRFDLTQIETGIYILQIKNDNQIELISRSLRT